MVGCYVVQEAEEGAATAIDPGGDVEPDRLPTPQTGNDGDEEEEEDARGQAEAEGEAAAAGGEQEVVEETTVRRPSLQAAGGAGEQQEGEERKTPEGVGAVATETDREEGIVLRARLGVRRLPERRRQHQLLLSFRRPR